MSYIGAQPTTAAFVTDQFSGDGSTTVFTMSVAPANTASVIVAVSGVLQDPSTYAVSGTSLTFSGTPPAGSGNISARYLGLPASGVATTAYRTLTEFTATSGQTTFSVPSYTVGFINVYRNGVMLGTADFTATSGTTVVLAAGATAGDLVAAESFFVSGVSNAIPAVAGAVNTSYITDGAVTTAKMAASSVTPALLAQPLTSGTAVASTSGTAIDFTGIPSWVKKITVMFNSVSSNGASNYLVQIGSGSPTTSGYLGSCGVSTTGVATVNITTGFGIYNNVGAATSFNGSMTIMAMGSNLWIASGAYGMGGAIGTMITGGSVTLSGTLDRIRITTINGTDTFDAGSINIMYE
tara:strand:+ start:62 stop:1117 length:1056 start_codon:yes stop_codon:yes gene_type:complete